MATLIDTLKSQGKATDYYSRQNLYNSMGLDKQFGAYTGSAQQNIGFQNVLSGGKPSPSQAGGTTNLGTTTSLATTGSTNALNGIPLTGLTTLQKQYIQQSANLPSSEDLYNQYANEMGINQQADLVAGLQKTTMELEKKIAEIEPMIQQRAGDFVITDAQRGRMVNAEQKPLRDQYLEAARQLNYADAGLTAKKDLLSTRLKFATEAQNRPLELLKQVMEFNESNKKSTGFDTNAFLKSLTTTTSTQPNLSVDDFLFGNGISGSGNQSVDSFLFGGNIGVGSNTPQNNNIIKSSSKNKMGRIKSKEKIA